MRFSPRLRHHVFAATVLGASILTSAGVVSALPASADTGSSASADSETILLKGSTKASYFWDDSSGRAGDTGLPASGKPMQKGMIASPSWPLFTEGYVVYKGKKAKFFVGDRGPGIPSNNGVMIDLDAKSFADLTGGTFNSSTLGVDGVGGMGHIKVDYVVTKWGNGVGKKNHPVAFASGAWKVMDSNPAEPPKVVLADPAQPGRDREAGKADVAGAPGILMPNGGAAPAALAPKGFRDLSGSQTAPITSGSANALAGAAGLAAVGGATFLIAGRLSR
ncbi:hypothetical protein [Streptosporangium sp. NPDC006007]|uniref:hypothetical protein n=1 Tax=Streptosporangium sp. NPDC006007 TaxID=3154575 RepID=UPI00339E3225